ncbi:Malonyl CoA-acyl carrier protein transacylase [Minicystis rosea]|nr:Malonyl CoA-acyl carrier protein transacylase [Minicystis rosea]
MVAGEARLTYRALESRANRLANLLRKLGVDRDVPVALCLDRSADFVIGMLAILKAGGAYVPIEPAYPPQRIAQIRDEAGARIVVTRGAFASAVEREGIALVRVDDDAAVIAAEPDARPVGGAAPASLVYVLFTSGSTGTPKGVAIEHRNLVSYVRGVAERLALPEDARYAHVSTFSADLGHTVLFPPLCLGGTLHVIPEALTTDPDAFGAYFAREGIDCLKIVPSHLSALLAGAHPERVLPRKLLVLGGEGTSWDLVDRIESLSPDLRVLNHYGPTETTVGVITHPVERGRRIPGLAGLPLGRPLPHARIYLLDEHRWPTPTGVPGEIWIGGAGVARGYWGRPDLTEERFLPDPFRPGERIYRTGDRGRLLADGTIVFLGRADHQVKIRGFRVELGEIESAIAAHPAVREAVVLFHDDASSDKHLGAYVVLHEPESVTTGEVRAFLEQRLPEHMIPSSWSILPALPLTNNGKVDRRALAAVVPERVEEEEESFVAPRNPIEEVLSGIWGDVFGKDRIGVHERFADLGGHSLIAIQIVARTRDTFRIELPIRAVFEAPTIGSLAERVAAAMNDAEGTPAPPIERVPRDAAMVLSFAQERLWFLHQLEPSSPFYNVASALRLTGRIHIEALTRSIHAIVHRHEVLRTTFTAVDGKPVAVLHEALDVQVPVTRWPDLTIAAREENARREAAEEARRPFDLERGPLLRARLLEIDAEEHVLLLTMHHIVSDGWTRGILHRELATLYRAFVAGKEPSLPELPIQYADYAAWQRRRLSGEVLERQVAYWKKQLDGAPPALDLPTDRPRPPVQTYRGANRFTTLSPAIGKALKELARAEGVTLFMVLLAGLDLLLHRWTGQRDIVIGTSVTSRNRADAERLVGFFVNALVLRTEVDDELPFTALIARVRDVCLGAYAHQDMPFERLVQELKPDPDPSRAPLFQVIFTMQNAPAEALSLPGLTLRGAPRDVSTVKYDLTFLMGEGRDGALGISIDYNVDLFDGATIDRMLGHLGNLLEAVARDASREVQDIPMLPDAERQTLLMAWNETTPSYSADECVHELFEAVADATPEAIAVVSGSTRLTFRALEERANRLARHLRRHGVGAESVVGLCHGRSVDIVVGILGILKAGAAYVPLDPSHPPARLAQILAEAGARVAVTEARHSEALAGVTVVCLDRDAAAIAAESEARIESEISAGNLAYVIFTSGSTGTPKGVAIEHRNLVSYVRGVAERLALPADARYAHVSTFAADLGNTVLFPPLCLGGTLHVIPEPLTTDPEGLGAYFAEHRIDCLKIVPSHLSALLAGSHPERVLPRALLVLGGEASSFELIDRIERLAPEMRILNHYGPTETTVGVITHAVERGRKPATPMVPLGRPLPGTQVYLLDARMAPVPLGVPGELYIGGAGVARGYLGQPERTKERFVPDPFSGRPGARLYRTGDRARYLPDGTLVFLGRLDAQVKIRGHRIELGEVESVLGAHVAIKDAVALADDDGNGPALKAYVVPRGVQHVDSAALQAWLSARLPEHMIPTGIFVLGALPLTPNGKIDRRALAALGRAAAQGDVYTAPRTPIEEVIQGIFCDVFGRERIGIHDRFGELGGHSLLAIQIVARVRQAVGGEVPLRALFEAPTIAGLAERVAAIVREDAGAAPPPPLVRVSREGTLPLSFAQERLWFLDQLDPGSTAYNLPARLRLTGALDVAALARALGAVVDRHEVLRTTFATVGGKPAQVIHDEVPFDLEAEDVAGDEEAVSAAAAHELSVPFDLARGPLWRARLLRVAPEDHVLLLTMHHIVSDAWTKGVLFREMAASYEAFHAGRLSPLLPLSIQYVDYAAWQRAWLSGEVLERQLAYWKSTLSGAPATLDLPTDRPRPAVLGTRGGRRRFVISAALSRALEALARREGATLFMTLLAAFDVLLHRWSGHKDISVGTPIAGRTRPEIELLLGFFVNTLVIRAKMSGETPFVELLSRVREACLGAYAHQDIPFERLVTDVAPDRDLGRLPLFQVLFTFQDAPPSVLDLPGLSLSGVAAETTTAKFDLTLGMGRGPHGLVGSIEHNSDLYDATTIDRMVAHFTVVLESIVAAPDQPIGLLPILPEAEKTAILGAGRAEVTHAPGLTLHQRFEAQVDRTPDAPAVRFEGRCLSYRELDARGNQLAHVLRRAGVGPNVLVGLCVERSIDLVVALLGIMKAGGAYVPLDPDYPQERLAFMALDAKVPVIVTQAAAAEKLPVMPEVTSILIDEDTLATESTHRPASASKPEDLAYVIYTSGSTGKPKGAMVTHHNVVRLFDATEAWYRFGPSDVWTLFHSYAFDFSVWELWGALLYGGRVVVVPYWVSRAPDAFHRLLVEEGVTVLNQTPSAFRQLVHAEERIDEATRMRLSLRYVIFGGEALDIGDLRPWWDRHGDTSPQLVNMYGITETTVHVTYRPVSRADLERPWSSVIGRAIPDLAIHVLDEHRQLVPIGVAGEMYVGGAGVARGYLDRPELTAARFIDDPFQPGGRLYKTGDRARRLPSGELEYLGRIDQQVKIRGFRIELGEIEAVLDQHASVRTAVVVAREDVPGDKRLVAYIVPAAGAPVPTALALRAHVKQKLPEVMVPAAFVLVESLPLTENGKIDRRALPAPEAGARLDAGEAFVAPRSAAEETLARIWAEVLRVDRVGIEDNFFASGGDSILSIQIVSRAQAAGLHLTPRQMFQHQTIAELAAVAGREQTAFAEQGSIVGPAPLTPIQRWWLEQEQPEPNHHNQSFFLEAEGPLEGGAVEAAIAAILEHHDALRLRVRREASWWEQRFVEPGGDVPMWRVDLRDVSESERAAVIAKAATEAQASLDVESGPVLRAVLFEAGAEQPGRVLFVAHHLAVDAVSWRILMEDFWRAYSAARRGERAALPPKTTSYRQWSERLAAHAASAEMTAESAYWLDGKRALGRALPIDQAGGENTEGSARSVLVSFAPEETEALLRRVPEAYRTQINDVLLTAVAQAFVGWMGMGPVLVDVEGHGREDVFSDVDLTRTVGWLTTIHSLELKPIDGGPGEVLKAVKEQIRAVPGRGLGQGLLRYLRTGDDIGARLAALPRAEVSFNYLGRIEGSVPVGATPFRRAREPAGAPHGPRNRRPYLIDVHGSVIDGRLHVRFTYSEAVHRRATIEALADGFAGALRALVTHCTSPEAYGVTPSDFPLVRLEQGPLDALAGRVERRIEDIHPLSPMQEGILFHALYATEPGVYYVQLAWTIEGRLDVAAFERAFQEVVERHQALRTSIVWEGVERPIAVVSARATLPFVERDLRGLAPEEQARAVERFTMEDRARGVDLGCAPLMRVALLRLGEVTWRFIWGSHHIAVDGWSMPILLDEALRRYEARAQGRAIEMDRAPSYGTYARWLAAQDSARAEAFWRRQLAGFTAPTPLPGDDGRIDRSRAARFDERRARLSDEASVALATFARRQRITMSTLVQGAWALLLGRYSGERDVVFGSTVSGRTAPVAGIDRMVGLFINTLAVRARIDPQGSAIAFLTALQEQQAELRELSHSALSAVQAVSEVPRGTPLFESLVVFENQPIEASLRKGSGSLVLTDARAVERPPYPLTLQSSFRGTLLLRIGFDAARVGEAMVERMLGHLQTMLEAIVRRPDRAVATLPILTEAERRRAIVEWNATAFAHPTDRLVPELLAAQAMEANDAVAVSFEGTEIGYRALHERVNRLAQALRKAGVRRGSLVGVHMERSIEMVVAMHAVLAAGGAYVPLDPEHPRERLAFMLEDCAPSVILTTAHLATALPESRVQVIRVDADGGARIAGEPNAPPERGDLGLDDRAYVIYTSGSTGRPKGAENTHRGMLNRLLWMQHEYRLSSNDRVLQKTPASFDVSVWELFWPLMFGARLVMARPGGHRDPAYLAEVIEAERITTMHFVPSMLAVFLDEANLGRCASLRRVIASGEALPPALVDRFHARLPGVELHNLYGPTEAAIDVTAHVCRPGASVVPIGKPIHNTHIYLLDDAREPVPEGIRGEIYIAGVQVGRGYLNRPELTAERFVRDPFVDEAEARMYRTGDLARRLSDGSIEYLGRADCQVKVRGVRIELGEIEATLVSHPAVRESVVVVREDRLVAYLVCSDGGRPTASALRGFLGERLPEAMLPASFVLLERLPLTESGKVDRRALPAPEDGEHAATEAIYAAPASAIEEALARIWAGVLKLPRVGVHDNFFEIGGDSILSIQIVSRALRESIHISLRQIFEHPTIAALAAVAGTRRVAAAEQGPVTGPVPLTPIERWWLEIPRVDAHHWNQGVFVEVRERVDAVAMEQALAAVIDHHDALRLRLVIAENVGAQTIAAPSRKAPLRVVDLAETLADVRRAAMERAATEAQASLDLAEGPIVRAVLFDAGEGAPSRLLLIAHHVAVDAVSWGIILDDLGTAYAQAKRGATPVLRAKTTSWKRWAEKLVEHAASAAVAAEIGYWMERPAAVGARLPIDHVRGDNDEGSARTVLASLGAGETEQLLRHAPEAYRTQINDLLLTALSQAFAQWTGAPGALFDFEGHGREEIFEDVDLTRTVGWFTSVYPLAIELPHAGGPGAAIKAVKEQIRAVPGRGMGHGLLRYLRGGEGAAALACLPAAEVSFNYLGQTDRASSEDTPFRWTEGPMGPMRSPRAARRYLVDVTARVVKGRLHVWLGYSESRHRRSTIEALGARFLTALRALVEHCVSPEARGHTPSDFAHANLSQDAVDMLVGSVDDDLA